MHQPSMPEAMSSSDLVKELTSNASLLLQRQVKLATIEAKQELQKGKTMVELFGTAGLCAYAGVLLLLRRRRARHRRRARRPLLGGRAHRRRRALRPGRHHRPPRVQEATDQSDAALRAPSCRRRSHGQSTGRPERRRGSGRRGRGRRAARAHAADRRRAGAPPACARAARSRTPSRASGASPTSGRRSRRIPRIAIGVSTVVAIALGIGVYVVVARRLEARRPMNRLMARACAATGRSWPIRTARCARGSRSAGACSPPCSSPARPRMVRGFGMLLVKRSHRAAHAPAARHSPREV